jgi:hypothetical protein
MNSKSIKIAVVLMIATMFLQMTPAGNPDIALAADGATGSITPGLFNAQYDTPITVLMEGLTVSADYGVAYGDGSGGTVGSIFNFTTGSTQTTMTFTTSFDTTQSSTGDVVTIGLWGKTACNFIQLGVALIIVLIVASIIAGLIKKGD